MSYRKIKTDALVKVAKLTARLPYAFLNSFGRFIGLMFYWLPNSRKKVAATNLKICFPELNHQQHKQLLKQNLASTGQALTESLFAYWGDDEKILRSFEVSGLEHIEEALKQQKGCLLLSYHHHLIELTTRIINLHLQEKKAHMLVRQHNNKDYEYHVDQARRNHCEKTIDKKDMKAVLKSLKSNHSVFYVPDQNFSYHFEYIDFFGQPAATVKAPARIAQATQAPVVPWFAYREGKKNKIEIGEPLEYFNEKDTLKTLKLMNQLFEKNIRKHPEQYLWVHKRFKNHPKGKNYIYK